MSDDDGPGLEEVQEELLDRAEQALRAGDYAEAKAAVEQWKAGEAVRAARRPPPDRRLPFVVAGGVVLTLLLGLSIPVGSTMVSVDVVVGAVRIEPDASFTWDGSVATRALEATGVDAITWGRRSRGAGDLSAMGDDLRLERLHFGPGATVQLDHPGVDVDIFVRGDSATAELSVRRGEVEVSGDSAASYEIPEFRPRETIVLLSDAPLDGEPFRLSIDAVEELRFDRMAVRGIAMVEQVAPDSAVYRAAIRAGRIELTDVERSLPLTRASSVELDLVGPGELSIVPLDDAFHLTLVGRAASLAVGPDGGERSEMPSLVEYLAESRRVAFLWTSALFLWGLAWSAKKWFS